MYYNSITTPIDFNCSECKHGKICKYSDDMKAIKSKIKEPITGRCMYPLLGIVVTCSQYEKNVITRDNDISP